MDKLSCDIHPRKMIKMVRHVSHDHIIIAYNLLSVCVVSICLAADFPTLILSCCPSCMDHVLMPKEQFS